MSFMQPQVVEDDWLEVDVAGSTCWIPADCVRLRVPDGIKKEGKVDEDSLREHFLANYESWAKALSGEEDGFNEDLAKEAHDRWSEIQRQLKDYCDEGCWPGREGELIQSVKFVHGFGARLSAPGYMDCTDWCVFDSQKEAEDYLEETYPPDEVEDEEDDNYDIAQGDDGKFWVTEDGEDVAGPFDSWEEVNGALANLRNKL